MSWATTVCERALLVALVAAGCVVEPEGRDYKVPFGGSGPGEHEDESSTSDAVPAPLDESGDADGGGPPKPSSDGDSSGEPADDSSTSGSDDGDSGEPAPMDSDTTGEPEDGDPGVRPASGPWSSCEAQACDVGLGCLEGEAQGAACTVACVGGDAASCPASPGDTVAPTCISVGGASVCALDCSGGLECPSGMACVADNDDLGPIEVCL